MPQKSKKIDEGEITKNAKLADAIRGPLNAADIPTVLCQPVRRLGGGHPDILIAGDSGQEVIVECKQDDPQLTRAKADAMNRLAKNNKIIGVAAVSYNGAASTDNINWAFRKAKAPEWEEIIRESNDLELRLRIEQAFFPDRRKVWQSIARIRHAVDQFTATCENMPGMADNLAKALKVDYRQADDDKKAKLRREMPVVAGLVLMQAMIFHRLLAQASAKEFDELDGMTIGDLGGLGDNADAGELRLAWREIQKVNYVSIFSLAEKLLADCSGIFPRRSVEMFGKVANACLDHARAGNDFAGSIFHAYLADQKTLAAYYTSAAAATLLAGVMFDSPDRLPKGAMESAREFEKATVMDPACGTGTLLLAAADCLREMSADHIGKKDFHRILMENVIKGMDVLDVGVAMAATSLGMMSPTVRFKHCGIRAVDMRVDQDRGPVLGSLQWLNESNLFTFDAAILRNIETGGGDPADTSLDRVSAVIMNPPFAVGQDGNTSFSFLDSKRDEEKMKKAYEERGRQYGFGSGSGAGPGFLQLAAKRVAQGGRFGTIIGVALGTGSKAYVRARRNLSRYFDIDTVIISRDPERINFSDSTNLNELMVVGTRNDTPFVEKKDAPAPKTPSRKAAFVMLTRNPATPAKAKELARLISSIDRSKPHGVVNGFGEYVMEEARDAPSWFPLNFADPKLYKFLHQASAGKLSGVLSGRIPVLVGGPKEKESALEKQGDYHLHTRTRKRNAPETATDMKMRDQGALCLEVADKGGGKHPAIWESRSAHRTFGGYFAPPDRRLMEQSPNVWMNPVQGCDKQARDYFKLGGTFGIRMSFGVNTSHALAAKFTANMPSASAFIPLTLRDDEDGQKTKAMVAWLNSSLGTALIVKHSTAAAGAKVMFSGHGVKTMAWLDVSRLKPESVAALADAYDQMVADEKKGLTLDRIDKITKDRQRAKLDRLVARALGIKGDFGALREMMSREMIFTGHGQAWEDDNNALRSSR